MWLNIDLSSLWNILSSVDHHHQLERAGSSLEEGYPTASALLLPLEVAALKIPTATLYKAWGFLRAICNENSAFQAWTCTAVTETVVNCSHSVGPETPAFLTKVQSEVDVASFLESSRALKLPPHPHLCAVIVGLVSGERWNKGEFLELKHCIELSGNFTNFESK